MEISNLPENQSASAGNRESGESDGEEERPREEEGDRYSVGNRWPRQETLALLKIRSEMDVAFRDSGLKAPLWEEVSRKLAELGYNRSSKKCKEKFENLYKYHRRTKEGRSGRANGKNYRFFEQLEALENHSMVAASVNPISFIQNVIPSSMQNLSANSIDTSSTPVTSSSKESGGTHRKKRKLSEFFERLMKEVLEKQENLQRTFIEAMEKCEQDRILREEAWKMQELERIKRERELLVREQSIAAAKDAAVLSFLQKFAEQATSTHLPEDQTTLLEKAGERQFTFNGDDFTQGNSNVENLRQLNGNGDSFSHIGSSRWPKDEAEALIRLRTNLDMQYHDNGPKGPLWEEISVAMKKLGYDRSAKRCKEKWENMNKYFKKVKESNRKRAVDAKTCPYFHQLDALYREKSHQIDGLYTEKTKKVVNSIHAGYEMRPEELLMHMMGAQEDRQQQEPAAGEGIKSENANQNQQEDNGENEDENEDEEEEDAYQIVANNANAMAVMD
ncbi:trihelix transcription factor GT-2-like [Tripterygium wilfordii]|uniref:Trihelix transcription factor GT-2-like n=1 Tax=Tripterygium wilfordii TaxID=458696 RepID=A0A7J7C0L0_TRIWF|nr:trihelix transcription factor GTL1-like [Tripterygium wilfordii]KAF5727690.1 trihelix transcription factor GT-2-like [Tripterygium wilfordii]